MRNFKSTSCTRFLHYFIRFYLEAMSTALPSRYLNVTHRYKEKVADLKGSIAII
jgi:hypothetical protein